MGWSCPLCGRDNAGDRCECGAEPPRPTPELPVDEDVVLPHEGAEAPPWAEEGGTGRRRRLLAFGSDQTRLILSFVIPAVGVSLSVACCMCCPVSPILAPLSVTIGCALYWSCPQAKETGRWVYLGVTALIWLVALIGTGVFVWKTSGGP
jgi:hypothetical protein